MPKDQAAGKIHLDAALAGPLFMLAVALTGGILAGLTVTLIRTLRTHNGPVII